MIEVGGKIGNFIVKAQLKKGGMGILYYAIDTMLNRDVALKIIHPQLARKPDFIGKFRTEAMTQAQMNHPNIVTIFCFQQIDTHYLIAMEYLAGHSLQEMLEREKRIPTADALDYLKQILRGLNYAHSRQIIHGDIKPGNILMDTLNRIKLSDFGIAKIAGHFRAGNKSQILGTPSYASPEQIMGKELDARSDLYSVGITFYEMVTGVVPFHSKNNSSFDIEEAHLHRQPPRPSIFNAEIPTEVENVILKAIQKKPEMRFQSAVEMLEHVDCLHQINHKGEE